MLNPMRVNTSHPDHMPVGASLPPVLPPKASFPALPAKTSACPYDKLQGDPKASEGQGCPLLTAPQQLPGQSSGAAGPGKTTGKAIGFTQ